MDLRNLGRGELAVLIPEWLLGGQLIDRAGMPHAIGAFGREVMGAVAIDEWMGASPIYSKRMQRFLRFEGDTVECIFKGMQLDIGAPPQFMDFRYQLNSEYSGEFWLDHCGALVDVEPMGEEYVVTMCHDIEDPTFDATAIATNPRAQIRPIHRPPREPADRHPHCHWTVIIDDSHPEVPFPEQATQMMRRAIATIELDEPDRSEDGLTDYSGPLLADIVWSEFGRTTLVRLAEEIAVEWHLLAISFLEAVRARAESEKSALRMYRNQGIGIAGVMAQRLKAAFDLAPDLDGLEAVFQLHPMMHPLAYTAMATRRDGDSLVVSFDRRAAATADEAWMSFWGDGHLDALQAVATEVNQRFVVALDEASGADSLVVRITEGDAEVAVHSSVELTRFSTGAGFVFEERSTPITITPRSRS
ncbi:MAG TPA: hypothetical protein PLP95_05235 [Microthrixaceae bacterium]|nr:hypothetical protein [Microthrixaceae bacterium]